MCVLHTPSPPKQRSRARLRLMASVLSRWVRRSDSAQLPPAQQPHVSTTQVGDHIPPSSMQLTKRSAGTALAGTLLVVSAEARTGRGPLPESMPTIIPMVRFGLPKPPGHGDLHNADGDLMHHQYRLSVHQWNPGPALPKLLLRLVGDFMRSFHKKSVITCHACRTNSSRTQATGTSPSCSTGTRSSPTLQSLLFTKLRQARTRGAW